MSERADSLRLPGEAGDIDIAIDWPEGQPLGWALVLHPHPLHGGTRDNKVVTTLARTLVRSGWVALRPNFRGVGASAGEFDHGHGEARDMAGLVQALLARWPDWQSLPMVLAGFSFGAAVAARLSAQWPVAVSRPTLLALVGTAVSRFDVPAVPADALIIHGEADEVVPLASVMDWARQHGLPVTVVPDADHFFHRRLTVLRDLLAPRLPVRAERSV
jgi:alpha/beta superfamily hydrolase